jgi:hypothetical protein
VGDAALGVRGVACFVAWVGIGLFAVAGGALMLRQINSEQFWLYSSLGLALYASAHLVGVAHRP